MSQRNIGIRMIKNKNKIMRRILLFLTGVIILNSCTVSKPTSETEKGFFFKMKHKKSDEK